MIRSADACRDGGVSPKTNRWKRSGSRIKKNAMNKTEKPATNTLPSEDNSPVKSPLNASTGTMWVNWSAR